MNDDTFDDWLVSDTDLTYDEWLVEQTKKAQTRKQFESEYLCFPEYTGAPIFKKLDRIEGKRCELCGTPRSSHPFRMDTVNCPIFMSK